MSEIPAPSESDDLQVEEIADSEQVEISMQRLQIESNEGCVSTSDVERRPSFASDSSSSQPFLQLPITSYTSGSPQFLEQPATSDTSGSPQFLEQPVASDTSGSPQFLEQPAASDTSGSPFLEQPAASDTSGSPFLEQPAASDTSGSPQFLEQPAASDTSGSSLYVEQTAVSDVNQSSLFLQEPAVEGPSENPQPPPHSSLEIESIENQQSSFQPILEPPSTQDQQSSSRDIVAAAVEQSEDPLYMGRSPIVRRGEVDTIKFKLFDSSGTLGNIEKSLTDASETLVKKGKKLPDSSLPVSTESRSQNSVRSFFRVRLDRLRAILADSIAIRSYMRNANLNRHDMANCTHTDPTRCVYGRLTWNAMLQFWDESLVELSNFIDITTEIIEICAGRNQRELNEDDRIKYLTMLLREHRNLCKLNHICNVAFSEYQSACHSYDNYIFLWYVHRMRHDLTPLIHNILIERDIFTSFRPPPTSSDDEYC